MSHLFGTKEAPGQKAYPNKDFDYWKNNPDQGIFEVKQALVRKKLSNGRLWNEYSKEMPQHQEDKYKNINPRDPEWLGLSASSGSVGSLVRASNPEMITGWAYLPEYPEEERIKSMLDVVKVPYFKAERVADSYGGMLYEKMAKPDMEAVEGLTAKYTEQKLERLSKLGFSEEMIQKAIEEEIKRDIVKVLNSPGIVQPDIGAEIEDAYERYKMKQMMRKSGENALGIGGGGSIQNPGVKAYDAFASAAEYSMFPVAQQRRMDIALKAHNRSGPAGADIDSGMASEIGGGAGGVATFEEKAFHAIKGMPGIKVKGYPGIKFKESKPSHRALLEPELAGATLAERMKMREGEEEVVMKTAIRRAKKSLKQKEEGIEPTKKYKKPFFPTK